MLKSLGILIVTIILIPLLPLTSLAQNLQTIKVEKGLTCKKQVFLKDIAQEVEYIYLETNDKCRIGGAGHLIATNGDNIVIAGKPFLRFDREGKFLNSISGKGKEPGQFTEVAGFDFDPTGGTFFIFDRLGKVINFQLNGDLIREQKVSSGLYASVFSRDLVLNLFSSRMVGLSNGFRVVINDSEGNPVSKLLMVNQETIENLENLSVQNTRSYSYRDSSTVWEGLCDTVYRISHDLKVTPRYYLNLGKHRLPKVLPITPTTPGYRKLIDKYAMPMRINESVDHLFLETSDRGQPNKHIFNKKIGICTTLPKNTLIINDFDGGPDFWPMGITSDGKMYMLINIVMLKQYWKPNTKYDLRYPERQLEFIRRLEKSNVNGNPIIMLVTPKDY
jgi:hypothetical protein